LFYEYGKDSHAGFGKGSIPGIEDCIGSDVAAFYRWGHPLMERLEVLRALNMDRCIKGYSDILSLDIVPSESFTWHEVTALLGIPLVDGHMEKKLANVQEAMYSIGALVSY
jgi:hypothetical protein